MNSGKQATASRTREALWLTCATSPETYRIVQDLLTLRWRWLLRGAEVRAFDNSSFFLFVQSREFLNLGLLKSGKRITSYK